jgi:hypothetical protein
LWVCSDALLGVTHHTHESFGRVDTLREIPLDGAIEVSFRLWMILNR